jgi:molybdopterin converting factor small subunit
MRVSYYGRLAEAAGVRSEEVAGAATVGALRATLARRVVGLGDAGKVRAVVDDVVVGEEYRLDEVEEVGFLPPVSGG